MYLCDKLIAHHVKQVLNESQLQYFLIDNSKDELQVILHLPLQDAVTEVVLSFRCLLGQQYVFDERIEDIKFHLAEGTTPEDYTSRGKYTNVFEHYI